jgi:hypothetical protein
MTAQLIHRAPGEILGDRKRCRLRRTRTEPEAKGFGCAPPPTLPLALRPAPIVYDPDHLLEGRSPTSLSPIHRGIVQWHAHSRCD